MDGNLWFWCCQQAMPSIVKQGHFGCHTHIHPQSHLTHSHLFSLHGGVYCKEKKHTHAKWTVSHHHHDQNQHNDTTTIQQDRWIGIYGFVSIISRSGYVNVTNHPIIIYTHTHNLHSSSPSFVQITLLMFIWFSWISFLFFQTTIGHQSIVQPRLENIGRLFDYHFQFLVMNQNYRYRKYWILIGQRNNDLLLMLLNTVVVVFCPEQKQC